MTRDSRRAAAKFGGCLAWLAVYAALTWALAVVVLRRLEIPQLAIGGSALIALMVCVAVAHLIRMLRVAIDLMLRFVRHESGVFFDGTKPQTAPSAASTLPPGCSRRSLPASPSRAVLWSTTSTFSSSSLAPTD